MGERGRFPFSIASLAGGHRALEPWNKCWTLGDLDVDPGVRKGTLPFFAPGDRVAVDGATPNWGIGDALFSTMTGPGDERTVQTE